jgi:hypothetical protein
MCYISVANAILDYDTKSKLSMGKENTIPAWQFKHAHYI